MKRKIVLICAIALVCTGIVYAAVAGAAAKPQLSFADGLAVCRFSLTRAGSALDATLHLYEGEAVLASWRAEGRDRLLIEGNCPVETGHAYRLQAEGTIDGEAFESPAVTATSPAATPEESEWTANFVDPQTRDWERISAAAGMLLAMENEDRLKALAAAGLILPEAYKNDAKLRDSVVEHLLQNAAEGHWGAYDYGQLALLQERLLDCLETGFEFHGEAYYTAPEDGVADGGQAGNDVTVVFTEPVTISAEYNAVSEPDLIWPLADYVIAAGYSAEAAHPHNGLDLAAEKGSEIHAAAAGTVSSAEYESRYGYVVVLDHGNGWETLYAHCSEFLVQAGDVVEQGQPIALVGSTGLATGPHCHFEVRCGGEPVDPMELLERDASGNGAGSTAAFETLEGLEHLAFEPSPDGRDLLVASGVDAKVLEWTPAEDILDCQLHFVDPRFAHPYFEGVAAEGSAKWVPGIYSHSPYTILAFECTKSSAPGGSVTGPLISCTVDLAAGKVRARNPQVWKGEEIPLTDEDLVRIAGYFAVVMESAQRAYDAGSGID